MGRAGISINANAPILISSGVVIGRMTMNVIWIPSSRYIAALEEIASRIYEIRDKMPTNLCWMPAFYGKEDATNGKIL
jgi:hypothetical protein